MLNLLNCARQRILLIVLVAVVTPVINGCSESEPEKKEIVRPVRSFQIPSPDQFSARGFPGRAKATQEVDLAFRISGTLAEYPLEVGDAVKKGDVAAKLDPRDFEVDVKSAQGKLDNASAAYRRAASEYQRELNILNEEAGATSQTAVDRKREAKDKARADIKSFEADLDSAKDQLSYTILKVPFDGNVVTKYSENYEDVLAKQAVVRIVDDSSIEMIVNIPESLISLASHVSNIKVVFDAFPDVEIAATIKEIGKEASSTTRTYPVTLIMPQPESARILPGMAGKAWGSAPKEMDGVQFGIEIPVAAVYTDDASGDTFVWVIDEKSLTVSKRQVSTQKVGDRGMRISSGLNEGEIIASAGVNFLFEGQKVKLLDSLVE